MGPPNLPPELTEDVNGYDVLAVLPSLSYGRLRTRTKETLREIQRRLSPHRSTLEELRRDESAFGAFLDAFEWAWWIARSTDSPTLRDAAYTALVHSLPGCELDAPTRSSMFSALAGFDERHFALLSALKAGANAIPNDVAGIMRQVHRELVRAGFVDDCFVTPLGYRFWRFVTA